MKPLKFFFALIMLIMLSTINNKATAQSITVNCGKVRPVTVAMQFNGCVNMTSALYENAPTYVGSEATVARNYTILGAFPMIVDSAEFTNDTAVLSKANLQPGQIITILLSAKTNDTLTLLHDGYYQGATATALISPATSASLKTLKIYVDKWNNYWKL